jgi:alpha/beta superfamily hydrolase
MVGRGEVLERMTTIAGPQGSLEALWYPGGVNAVKHRAPVLLCPPHPSLGGNIDSPVLADLVWMLGRRRHPTLRFNYAGVGASLGVRGDPARDLQSLVDDAAAGVLHLLQTTGEQRCCVVGLSIGALVAARLACVDDGVDKVALISPPVDTGLIDAAALDRSGVLWRCYVGGDDVYAPVDRVRAAVPSVSVIAHGNHTFSRGLQALCTAVADELAPDGGDD